MSSQAMDLAVYVIPSYFSAGIDEFLITWVHSSVNNSSNNTAIDRMTRSVA